MIWGTATLDYGGALRQEFGRVQPGVCGQWFMAFEAFCARLPLK